MTDQITTRIMLRRPRTNNYNLIGCIINLIMLPIIQKVNHFVYSTGHVEYRGVL